VILGKRFKNVDEEIGMRIVGCKKNSSDRKWKNK
jgi:hypothetical protein